MSDPQGYFPGNEQGLAGSPQFAGFWWRFLASFIDGLIIQATGCLIGMGIGLIFGVALVATGGEETTKNILSLVMNSVSTIIGLVLGWLYSALLESSEWQATLGKRLCGLKVTTAEGERLTFGRASGRYFGKFLSTLICFVGYIMAAFTQKKQALHDIIAGTVVIKALKAN